MRDRLGDAEVVLRRWRTTDETELQRVVSEALPLELGYWLHPEWVGRGLATRAVALLVAEAFREGADRVEIVTDVANIRSRPAQEPVTSAETGTDIVWRRTPDRGGPGESSG